MGYSYCSQLKALLIRNVLIKIRAKRTFACELLTPLIYLMITVIIAATILHERAGPYSAIKYPGILEKFQVFDSFLEVRNHTVAVAPNTTETREFIRAVNDMYMRMQMERLELESGNERQAAPTESHTRLPITFQMFNNPDDLADAYWRDSQSFQLGVVFGNDNPITNGLKYEIRINPHYVGTPPTSHLYSDSDSCLGQGPIRRQWNLIFPDPGEICPAQLYYISGFIALQSLIDFTKIKLDAGAADLTIPNVAFELLPRTVRDTEVHGPLSSTIKVGLVVISIFLPMTMAQFTTYLMVILVNEKENHSRATMKMMGVSDSAYWLSWFIIYSVLIAALAVVAILVLHFQTSLIDNFNLIVLFMGLQLYGCTTIMLTFVFSTFFTNTRTGGFVASLLTTIINCSAAIDFFVEPTNTVASYFMALVSPLAFSKFLQLGVTERMLSGGLTWENMWSEPSFVEFSRTTIPCGAYFIFLLIDNFVYLLLAFYLDNVWPNEHRIRRSPLFCLNPRYWSYKKSVPSTSPANGEPFTYLTTEESEAADVESVPLELKGREAIRIEDLHKTYKRYFKPGVKAVNGINLTIYEGQITAILGHNGAGKTTLFNMLLGVCSPTSGTASIYGYDIRNSNDMEKVRRMTGVCPQHDTLFKTLTPREHLNFYGRIRGIHQSDLKSEVERTLSDLDLLEKADCVSANMSGGQKRKLCIGIAIIGDPKIIVLDEPSAGVDPYSRRHVWSVLQSRKAGKVILLSTHFMDEADILAERKAVISKGRLRCCGSSLFLKNKFGIGYHLTLVLNADANESMIFQLVQRHVPKAERARRHGRELSFILPHTAVNSFPDLFAAVEDEVNKKRGLGVTSYGVAMTTLEEVFLHLEKDEDEVEPDTAMENISRSMLKNRAMSRSLSIPSKSTSYHSLQNEAPTSTLTTDTDMNAAVYDGCKVNGDISNLPQVPVYLPLSNCEGLSASKNKKSLEKTASEPAPTTPDTENARSPAEHPLRVLFEVTPNTTQKIIAMMTLRIKCLFRDYLRLINLVLIPLALVGISFFIESRAANESKLAIVYPSNRLRLDGSTYEPAMRVALRASDFAGRESPRTDLLLSGLKQANATLIDFSDNMISPAPYVAPHIMQLNMSISSEQDSPNFMQIAAAYNDTALHSLPVIINLVSNAVYKMVIADKLGRDIASNMEPIVVESHPLNDQYASSSSQHKSVISGFAFGFTLIMISATVGAEMVYDREIRAKNQLRVNGVPFTIYFLSVFLVAFCLLFLVFLSVILIGYFVFQVSWLYSVPSLVVFGILFLLFCPSSILVAATLSYGFKKTESAASMVPGIMIVPGLLPYMIMLFSQSPKTQDILHAVNSFINPAYFPFGAVYQMVERHTICLQSTTCQREGNSFSNYATKEIFFLVAGSVLAIFVWTVMLVFVDLKSHGSTLRNTFRSLRISAGDGENLDYGEHEDEDVRAERARVAQVISNPPDPPPVVVVQNLRKEYGHKVALRELSLAVQSGEVFGLLGHNGAGKTTAMKIITAEEAPTHGKVQVGGHDIMSSMSDAFQKLGYCPQHDAQWKKLTVREHLELYAAIRGVKPRDIKRMTDAYIKGLQITEHANKYAYQCSGGTRRKLSFAMAMVGNPAVVLMDEPSTGMDPRSKRFLWDTILASFQGTRGAILTTHAMEEADALCSRVGIMVKGELRCLGPTQHLKNLYGAGYNLEMKLKDLSAIKTVTERHDEVVSYITNLFKDAVMTESFSDRLVFEIPQKNVSSVAQCFRNLEKAKKDLNILEYSFSQTTLEQVFLKFGHDYEEED